MTSLSKDSLLTSCHIPLSPGQETLGIVLLVRIWAMFKTEWFTHRCGVWAPTLSCNRIRVTDAALCCILRFLCASLRLPPWMWLRWKVMLPHSELKVNLHLLWALLAFVSLLCRQTVGICCCHCHPTHSRAPEVCPGSVGGHPWDCSHPWEYPFVP